MNVVCLTGRLTKDPEVAKTPSGTSVCKFILAVNRRIKKEGQPDADFIGCTAWGKTADMLCQYQRKGNLIGVTGRIQTSSYDNQQGQRVFRTDVVAEAIDFLQSRNQNQGQPAYNNSGYSGYNQPGYSEPNYGGGYTQPAQDWEDNPDFDDSDLNF